MRILAFDTATPATTVAITGLPGGAELEARDDPSRGERPRHASKLMPLIAGLLERSGTSWGELDRIAVGVGPGTFTGLRIGIATAKALARGRELPVVGVSTLQSLALGAVESAHEVVLAVLDARRGEVFAAAWQSRGRDQLGGQVLAPRVIVPGKLEAVMPGLGSSVLAVGDGAVEFRAVFEPLGILIPTDEAGVHRVSAVNHGRLARGLPAARPDEISPQYLRLPDAEIARRASGSQ